MSWKVGYFISLAVVVALIITLCLFFLAKRKAWRPLTYYVGYTLLYSGLFILSWFYEGMEMALTFGGITLVAMMVALVMVYQNDLKVLFLKLSRQTKKKSDVVVSDEDLQNCIEEIVKACQTMSKQRMGSLIVIVPNQIPEHILNSGVKIGALVSASLLESIFNTKAPIHDGAVLIKGNKILAAGCFLPLSQTQSISKDIGTRHRAAIGVTEETDNISIVTSEENGIISVCKRGELRRYVTPERLSDMLHETFDVRVSPVGARKKYN